MGVLPALPTSQAFLEAYLGQTLPRGRGCGLPLLVMSSPGPRRHGDATSPGLAEAGIPGRQHLPPRGSLRVPLLGVILAPRPLAAGRWDSRGAPPRGPEPPASCCLSRVGLGGSCRMTRRPVALPLSRPSSWAGGVGGVSVGPGRATWEGRASLCSLRPLPPPGWLSLLLEAPGDLGGAGRDGPARTVVLLAQRPAHRCALAFACCPPCSLRGVSGPSSLPASTDARPRHPAGPRGRPGRCQAWGRECPGCLVLLFCGACLFHGW